MENMFRLFFDLTVNDGWNGVALMTYTIIGLFVTFIIEKKRG
jgi:hypothetical protein